MEPINSKSVIAHACGSYNGLIYTNSVEAFNVNYARGFKRFEIDFLLTTNKDLISLHNAWGYNFISAEDFKRKTLKSKLKYLGTLIGDIPFTVNKENVFSAYERREQTPITIYELATLCMEYPDVEFILDTKSTNPKKYMEQYDIIRLIFEVLGMDMHQIVPQFYNIDMAVNLLKEFNLPKNIYTLYLQSFNQERILKELDLCDISAVTISTGRIDKHPEFIHRLHEVGKECYTHTATNEDEIKKYLQMKADSVYTFAKVKVYSDNEQKQ